MPREMLKLRKGDSAIMIKNDGSVELAGVNDKPLMSDKGMISPVVLFAAAWAKKDDSLMNHLVDNFKNCVREGYFGTDAQNDFKQIEIEAEKIRLKKEQEGSAAKTQPTVAKTSTVAKTPEEDARHKEEERRLEQLKKEASDPRMIRQMEAMKKGAKKIVKTDIPMDSHRVPDDWTPDTASGAVTFEQETPTPMTTQEQLDRRDS
jgi:hypothetical protein